MSMKPSERAKAEYSYEAKYPNELSFVEGDIITILSKHVPGIDSWWEGEANGKIGIFPSSFVELLPAEEENTSVTDKNFGESRTVLHGPKPRQLIGDGPIQLWQQILQLLVLPPSSELESGLVEWTRKQKYGFRILQPQKLAQLWGKVKNKPAMNSEKLFRGLRYYYGKSMLEKVPGQENTYQFVFDITEILGYDPVDGIPVVTPSKEGSPVDQNASQT